MSAPRLAILFDYAEEQWPSMELTANQLAEGLKRDHGVQFVTEAIRPAYRRRFEHLGRRGRNPDRLINRFWDYPRYLRQFRSQFDGFHIADHSYSHLIHPLPAERTGIYCHDLDTFRCLLDPAAESRPWWFKKMAQRILDGLRRAAVVFHSTQSVREQILSYGIVEASRLVHAPPGVSPAFFCIPEHRPDWVADGTIAMDRPYLFHVGSGIPRKRVDVLLKTFAAVRTARPDLRLIQIGAQWTPEQRRLIDRLGIHDAMTHRSRLPEADLVILYRFAAAVLQPSEAEGFGLPVIEALASGAPVLASDIPVLREVGGSAAHYAPVGEIDAWTAALLQLLEAPNTPAMIQRRRSHAGRYTWSNHCRIIAEAYGRLLR